MVGIIKRGVDKLVPIHSLNLDMLFLKYCMDITVMAIGFLPCELMCELHPWAHKVKILYNLKLYLEWLWNTPIMTFIKALPLNFELIEYKCFSDLELLTWNRVINKSLKLECLKNSKMGILFWMHKTSHGNLKMRRPSYLLAFIDLRWLQRLVTCQRFGLTLAYNKRTRRDIHTRRLVLYQPYTLSSVAQK